MRFLRSPRSARFPGILSRRVAGTATCRPARRCSGFVHDQADGPQPQAPTRCSRHVLHRGHTGPELSTDWPLRASRTPPGSVLLALLRRHTKGDRCIAEWSPAAVTCMCLPALFACSGDDAKADPTTPPTTSSASRPRRRLPRDHPHHPTRSARYAAAAWTARVHCRAPRPSCASTSARSTRSWHARSGAVPRQYSTPGCISCRGLASSMDKIRRDGGFYRGGDWIVTSTTPIPLQSRDDPSFTPPSRSSRGSGSDPQTTTYARSRRTRCTSMYIDLVRERHGS